MRAWQSGCYVNGVGALVFWFSDRHLVVKAAASATRRTHVSLWGTGRYVAAWLLLLPLHDGGAIAALVVV